MATSRWRNHLARLDGVDIPGHQPVGQRAVARAGRRIHTGKSGYAPLRDLRRHRGRGRNGCRRLLAHMSGTGVLRVVNDLSLGCAESSGGLVGKSPVLRTGARYCNDCERFAEWRYLLSRSIEQA